MKKKKECLHFFMDHRHVVAEHPKEEQQHGWKAER